MLLGGPAAHVGTNLGEPTEGAVGADGVELGEIDARQLVERGADVEPRLIAPTLAHPLGTDDLGQDLLARILQGGRISLAVGIVAMLIALSVGVIVGALAGY